MSNFRVLLSIVSAIVLFLYGLEAFSHEIQTAGGETLSKWLSRFTERRWRAVLLGGVATAIVQSSSAITALTLALVDAGTMSFWSSRSCGSSTAAWELLMRAKRLHNATELYSPCLLGAGSARLISVFSKVSHSTFNSWLGSRTFLLFSGAYLLHLTRNALNRTTFEQSRKKLLAPRNLYR